MGSGELSFLVKTRGDRAQAVKAFSIDGKSQPTALTPLMPSIGAMPAGALGVAAPAAWYKTQPLAVTGNAWDMCHQMVQGGLGLTGAGDIEFAEPNLSQQWAWESRSRIALGLTASCDQPQGPKGPPYSTGEPYWHLGDDYSQLLRARGAASAPTVRIAHLDTGYDPNHLSKPAHLRVDLQKNFADGDRPDDATDKATAAVNPMFGHGTGTLSLLAGKIGDRVIGAACDMEIVPVRVANWVVLFENQAIVQAFDYVHDLSRSPQTRIDVVTMSMGGLASQAWADAVNALYEAGIVVVTAAGNNFGNLPTRYIVYPARFNRVVAACGAMSSGQPYADLPLANMAGCYGPAKKMPTALTAYTPNTPWARFGCPNIVDLDGGGTSAATPQIAAAAALWIRDHRAALDALPHDKAWMKVEAVRRALFTKANKKDEAHFGEGLLRAADALTVGMPAENEVRKQAPDDVSFPLLRVLTGLGVQGGGRTQKQRMIELEAVQLSQRSSEIERLLASADPGDPALADTPEAQAIVEALADHPQASRALKSALAGVSRGRLRRAPPAVATAGAAAGPVAPAPAITAPGDCSELLPEPPSRRLRVFAFDPVLRTNLETLDINQATLTIPWEKNLAPGPAGEYLEVIDIDPAADRAYLPVDLNHPFLLAQDGLAPTEGNPLFHQQMVYAVAMKTIGHFERALGRVALWADRDAVIDGEFDFRFVRRVRVYPHALSEANAYYSPDKRSLLFGYFPASKENSGDNLPGGLIFSCLSHDIVAHETTHALLDGVHRFYREPSSVDMLAFHEAFADIVALFQHFTLPEALRHQIRKTRGDLSTGELLAGLAMQFGQAIGNRGVLRSAIAQIDPDTRQWKKIEPKATDYNATEEPHARGAVLVAAVFDAFLQVYARKTRDLKRLASGGTGVLPDGEIPFDLSERMAQEAAKVAERVLHICIRALDYCPPFDLTFGEYLRALITADLDLVPADDDGYRVAFISAFRARGIYPDNVRNLSVEGLSWNAPYKFAVKGLADALQGLSSSKALQTKDRHEAFCYANKDAHALYELFMSLDRDTAEAQLGIALFDLDKGSASLAIGGEMGRLSRPMLKVRPCRRVRPSGEIMDNLIIEITQRWKPNGGGDFIRGGCTIVADLEGKVKYVVGKHLASAKRLASQRAAQQGMQAMSGYENYWDNPGKEPFAMIHRGS